MLPFSLILLWKNEKKVVTFDKCITEGREKVRTVDSDEVIEDNEYELVHVAGTTVNASEITDNDFGIIAHNSYRLKRKVEMYQWRETVHDHDEKKSYSYDKVWSEEPISSGGFHEKGGHENPGNDWPFRSRTFEAANIMLGKFKLTPA